MRLLITFLLLLAASRTFAVNSFDDITFWIGEGDNRAALAIDWQGEAADDEALVWGYCWDGALYAETMLRDVLAADDRLYAKLGELGLGTAVLGLGYDLDDDGAFGVSDVSGFDSSGVVYASTSDADGALATDPGDLYREGWYSAYWHYGVGQFVEDQIVWSSSPSGVTDLMLVDGQWHGMATATSLSEDQFPENMIAATPPGLAGDFNGDGVVGAADYTVWRDGHGSPAQIELWRTNYGASASPAFTIPEPATAVLVVITLLLAPGRSVL